MKPLNQFYLLTSELIQLLGNLQIERDKKMIQVETFLYKREVLMNEIVPPYTHEEVELGQKIIQLNSRLSKLLQAEKSSIQKDMKELQAKKESNTKYVNPYKNISIDGMFYDKRK